MHLVTKLRRKASNPLPLLASGVTREICANPMKNFKEPPADYIIHSVIENL